MSKARILAVDDQRYFRELVEGLLREQGYEVRTAASGEEALHILSREDFAVVVTDLVMPEMDGRELVQRIKERNPDQKIIVISGVVDVTTAVEAMRLGATDYIVKPFDGPAIGAAIDKLLEADRLRQQHAQLMEENLEVMGVLSLFERAAALFTKLAVEPLSERILEGLCLATRAQSAVIWTAETLGSETLQLSGARGLIRVEDEASKLTWRDVVERFGDEADCAKSIPASPTPGQAEVLFLPLRFAGDAIGLVRLSDRMEGDQFSAADRAACEKFCDLGSTALRNALRFEALERRSLKDPDTLAYTEAYFEDVVRNEIQKANRFGHRFSILRIEFPARDVGHIEAANRNGRGAEERARTAAVAATLETALRSTDLLGASDARSYSVPMPQTDALGAGILAQRIRGAFAELDDQEMGFGMRLCSATFPVDGTQLESLNDVLSRRVDQAGESLLVKLPALAKPQAMDSLLDRMLELGDVAPVEVEGQILAFVLEDTVRRPADRGVLFVSPGARWLPDVLETLEAIRERESRTEIVVIAESEGQGAAPEHTWAVKSALDSRRPFAVYFGDGPAYAMIGQVTTAGERAPIFQTADRVLVENLAFGLQRELGIVLSV